MIYAYPCEFTSDRVRSHMAIFPDVPQAITGGRDRAEARAVRRLPIWKFRSYDLSVFP